MVFTAVGDVLSVVTTSVGSLTMVCLSVVMIVSTFLCQCLEICVGIIVAVGVVESLQDGALVEMHRLNVLLVIVMMVEFGVSLVFRMVLAINMLRLFVMNLGLSDVSFSMSILMEELVMRERSMGIGLTLFQGV